MSDTPKPPKHPKKMKTHEAVRHLFHPDVVKHIENTAHKEKQSRPAKTE
jgi:hypothetical protein